MDKVISIAAIMAMLVGPGLILGLANRKNFAPEWLGLAVGLILLEDVLLTNGYGLLPSLIPGEWNWQGKGFALLAMLAVAAHPALGWKRVGLTFEQRPGSLRQCLPVVGIYLAFFLAIAIAFPDDSANVEQVAFQLTMPGLEEEIFYRGILLFALGEALRGRVSFLGIKWGWGAVLSSMLFGLTHAFSFAEGEFAFEPAYFVLTFVPSFLGVWLREKSGSLVLPILVHNAGNSLSLLI